MLSPVHLFLVINVTLCNVDLAFDVLQNIFFKHDSVIFKKSAICYDAVNKLEHKLQTSKNVVIQA
jgi:hypothetical protein